MVYQCLVCKLHYPKKDLAQKCQEWCSTHKSCNLEIIKFAIENNPTKDKTGNDHKKLK